MSYRVRIESFEGPFDLLLYLVSRQKVSIGSISLSEITDPYLSEVQRILPLSPHILHGSQIQAEYHGTG